MDIQDRCKERVYPNEKWGSFHPYRCQRKAWKDDYCKQHHPDSVAKREKEANERWKNKPRCPTCQRYL